MSTLEVKPAGGPNDQDAINWTLAAARDGQRVALVGQFVVSLKPIAANPRYFGAIQIPNNRWLDLTEGSILLAPNQPMMVDGAGKPSTAFAALITNASLSGGKNIRVSGGPGPVDGNALNQKANDCRFNGIQFRNQFGCLVEGVTVKNIRGLDGMGGPTESFVFDCVGGGGSRVFRDCVATADPPHKAESSTGFSANGSADGILWDHDEAYGLKDHGFTSWKCSEGTRIACRSHDNGSTGARWEYGTRNRDIGCSYTNNAGSGLVLQGCTEHVLTGHSISGNAKGLVVVEGASYEEGPGYRQP